MFHLGQTVISKKIGLPIVGTIVGMMIGRAYSLLYIESTNQDSPIFKNWDKLYPDWQNKIVYSIFSEYPAKILSFEEFKNYFSEVNDIELLIRAYSEIKKYSIHSYPEDDLELYEEEVYEKIK